MTRAVEIFLRDVHPYETRLLDLKLTHFVAAEVADHLAILALKADDSLVEKGYRSRP